MYENWPSVEACSGRILIFQEERLGKLHPETLKTLLWIFVVQLDSPDEGTRAMATGQTLLQRLRDESVRTQRYLEVTRMEQKIALFYNAYDHRSDAESVRKFLDTEAAQGSYYSSSHAEKLAVELSFHLQSGHNPEHPARRRVSWDPSIKSSSSIDIRYVS